MRTVLALLCAVSLFRASSGHAEHNHKPTSMIESRKSSVPQPQLLLFCNITSPCKPCSGGGKQGKSDTHHCKHFTHVQDLDCIVDLPASDRTADVKKELLQKGSQRQLYSRSVHHQGCANLDMMHTAAWFEAGAVGLLFLSIPVVIWRKRAHSASRG